nr:hypothetical protein [Tanacetum cinerariifolium]
MIELRADVKLKDTIVVAMPKLVGEGFYTYDVRVEYGWKPPTCACCKVFGNVQDECPNNLGSGAVKKPNQAPKGVPVGPMMGFKPAKHMYRPKKNNLEKLIIDGKIKLVDDEGKPLKKFDYPSDHDSEDDVAPVDNEMTSFLALERVGYGINSLLKQWRETYENANYDYDPYDEDMYQGQEIPENIQSICDNLDIKPSYARAMIDVWANVKLKVTLVVAIQKLEGDGYILNTIRIEYEWEPPRCEVCMVFGYDEVTCSKRVVNELKKQNGKYNDDFQQAPKITLCGINMSPKL